MSDLQMKARVEGWAFENMNYLLTTLNDTEHLFDQHNFS